MKYLIASDIHGSAYWTERLVAAIESEQPDRIVLLGDLLYHGPRNDLPRDYAPKRAIPLLNALADRIIAVRGNCDAEVDQMVLDFPVMADYATPVSYTHLDVYKRQALCDACPGMVMVDEAYVELADDSFGAATTAQGLIAEHPNLVILHTLSKAFGAAGTRLEMCIRDRP